MDADMEAKMLEERSAMDRLSSTSVAAETAKAAKAAKAAKGGRCAKAAAPASKKSVAAANSEHAALRTRLGALEAAVTKVHKERDELRMLHAYATEENRQLTIELHEVQQALQSATRAAAANPALSRWLSAKELDLTAFVADIAYEYYTRHTYGPLTAALISYGVLLGPLAASALFFLRHAKALWRKDIGARQGDRGEGGRCRRVGAEEGRGAPPRPPPPPPGTVAERLRPLPISPGSATARPPRAGRIGSPLAPSPPPPRGRPASSGGRRPPPTPSSSPPPQTPPPIRREIGRIRCAAAQPARCR